jgi:signal transduction histidine kinase
MLARGLNVDRRRFDVIGRFSRRLRSLIGWSTLPRAREIVGTAPERQRAERVLAAARVFFAASALAAVIIDPTQPAQYPSFTYVLLAAYLAGAGAIWVTLLRSEAPSFRFQLWMHSADLLWAVALTAITEGPNSLFFLLFMFVLLAAGSRWGFRETVETALVAIGLLVIEAAVSKAGEGGMQLILGRFDANRLIMRSAYLLMGGALLGYLAEEEKQRRAEAATITRIISSIRVEASVWATFETVAAEVFHLFGANRLLLLFEEIQSGRSFLWIAECRADGGLRTTASEIAAGDRDQYRFDRPADAWSMTIRSQPPAPVASDSIALDRDGRRIQAAPPILPQPWTEGRSMKSVMGVTVAFADIGSGVVLLFDAEIAGAERLRFLQRLANQIAPAMYSVYLLRRLRSRVGALERARIARELHDGIIQSLIGLEMRIDTLSRHPRDSDDVVEELRRIQQMLTAEIRDLRDLTHTLEPFEFSPRQLLEHLHDLVDRFQRETGIAARFVSDVEDVTLSPPVCHELARITQEALVNVRKHSGARNVVVRFTSEGGSPQLIIDNDGRSLDFTGRLSQADLDRRRKGPVVIKERVRAIGGDLAIESSDRGVRLEITLPPRVTVRHRTA